MAPKKRAPAHDSDSDEPVEKKPKAKRTTKAKAEGGAAEEKRPKRPPRNKTEKLTEPETNEEGWTLHPPSLIFRSLDGESGTKIAAFDLDGTLALTKGGLSVPKDVEDFILYNKSVPAKLQELDSKGYKIVIFSNQNGIKDALKGKMAAKVEGRIMNVLKELGMPHLPVVMATNKDEYRKPDTGMWDFWVEHGNKGVQPDKKQSYYVGDAAGRPGDFADSDLKFAEKIGISFKTSSDFFGDPARKMARAVPTESSGMNDEMANCFRELAAAQTARGDNAFGVRATEKSASIIAAYPTKITSGKELSKLPGIGKGSVAKIDEFLATGTLSGINKDPEQQEENKQNENMALKFV